MDYTVPPFPVSTTTATIDYDHIKRLLEGVKATYEPYIVSGSIAPGAVTKVAPVTEVRNTLTATSRVNKATLGKRLPKDLLADIKNKLAKDILHQLLQGDMIEIESSVNPKTGSATFVARITFVKDANKKNNESTNTPTTTNP